MIHLKIPNYSLKFLDAYVKFMISRYLDKKIPRINLNQYDKELKNCFGCSNKKLIRNLIIEHYFKEDYFKEISEQATSKGNILETLVKEKFGTSNFFLINKIEKSSFQNYKDEEWYRRFISKIDKTIKNNSQEIISLVNEIEGKKFNNFYEYFRELILIEPKKMEKFVSNNITNRNKGFSVMVKLYNLSEEIKIDGKLEKINIFMIKNFIDAKSNGLVVCPYCNRNYINSRDKYLGSEIDHFYNKKKFPMFAISLYNFIPSCSTCNRLKGTHDLKINPYLKNDKYNIKFDIIKDLNGYEVNIKHYLDYKLSDINSCPNLKNDIINILKLDRAYEVHNHEVKEMVRREEEYGTEYRKFLKKLFSGENDKEIEDKIDVLIYGDIVIASEDELINRSLGKFKKDVYEKIKEWKTNE